MKKQPNTVKILALFQPGRPLTMKECVAAIYPKLAPAVARFRLQPAIKWLIRNDRIHRLSVGVYGKGPDPKREKPPQPSESSLSAWKAFWDFIAPPKP